MICQAISGELHSGIDCNGTAGKGLQALAQCEQKRGSILSQGDERDDKRKYKKKYKGNITWLLGLLPGLLCSHLV